MPTNLLPDQRPSAFSPKKLRLSILFLLSPLFFFGQTLTGLWTGAFNFDSSTVRKDQSFEIALTEYKGKVYGYSRSEFIVDDTLYYVVKRVKGTIVPGTPSGEGDICEVTDEEIVAYNFRGKLEKGVKVTSIFRRNQTDSAWYLDGTWKTNATKKYYAVTGKVTLAEEKDLTASKIFPHLEELKLANDVVFYKDRKEGAPVVKLVKPEKIDPVYPGKTQSLSINSDVAVSTSKPNLDRADTKPVPEEEITGIKKTELDLPRTETKPIATNSVNITPAATTKTIAENKIPDWDPVIVKKPEGALARTDTKPIPSSVVDIKTPASNKTIAANKVPVTTKNDSPVSTISENKPVADPSLAKINTKQNQPIVKNNPGTKTTEKINNPVTSSTKPVTETKKQDIVSNNPVKQTAVVPASTSPQQKEVKKEPVTTVSVIPKPEKPLIEITSKAASVEGRKSEFSQVVSFKSDSLELSLYDNGEIDGDTVSVYMDGQVIMSKQGLKASAIKKTIYITPGNEDFTLVLFAENLGKYPPNTGLLVVHDGEDVYNLRFSSDFQKNTGIVFRRKR